MSFYRTPDDDPPPAATVTIYPPAVLADAGQEPIEATEKAFAVLYAPEGWTLDKAPATPVRAAKAAVKAPAKTTGKRRTAPPPPTMIGRDDVADTQTLVAADGAEDETTEED